MRNIGILLFVLILAVTACSGSKDTKEIIVASQQGDCVGVAPQKCLLIKEKEEDNWTFLYSGIEGFDYKPGFEYVIRIREEKRENPVQDQSSIRYILVKEISKTQKRSANLPVFNRNQ